MLAGYQTSSQMTVYYRHYYLRLTDIMQRLQKILSFFVFLLVVKFFEVNVFFATKAGVHYITLIQKLYQPNLLIFIQHFAIPSQFSFNFSFNLYFVASLWVTSALLFGLFTNSKLVLAILLQSVCLQKNDELVFQVELFVEEEFLPFG